jgi:type II secretion system protein G
MKPNFKKGFTLIELLVVISIISLLTSIVLASINMTKAKARDARRISDISQLRIALEMYHNDTGSYPTTLNNGALNALNVIVPTQIRSLPNDPLNTGATPSWAWSNQNTYYYWDYTFYNASGSCATSSSGFTLWYRLETRSDGNAPTPCVNLDSHSFIVKP